MRRTWLASEWKDNEKKERESCAAVQAFEWDLLAKIIMSGQSNHIDVYYITADVPKHFIPTFFIHIRQHRRRNQKRPWFYIWLPWERSWVERTARGRCRICGLVPSSPNQVCRISYLHFELTHNSSETLQLWSVISLLRHLKSALNSHIGNFINAHRFWPATLLHSHTCTQMLLCLHHRSNHLLFQYLCPFLAFPLT